MVRHHTFNVGIMGSNPIASTTKSTCKPRMNQLGQWGFKVRRWWPHLPKVLTFNEVRQDSSMSFKMKTPRKMDCAICTQWLKTECVD